MEVIDLSTVKSDTVVVKDLVKKNDRDHMERLYTEFMRINDPEYRRLIDETVCPKCDRPCRIRRYMVESICCDNRVCNECHYDYLSGTTTPHCMHCLTVWTQYNLYRWFTDKHYRQILTSRVVNHYQLSRVFLNLRRDIADVIKTNLSDHFKLLRRLKTERVEYNTLFDMLTPEGSDKLVLSKNRKYTDIKMGVAMDITDDCIDDLIEAYDPETLRLPTKDLEKLRKILYKTVHDIQSIMLENSLFNCPKCDGMIPQFSTEDMTSISCPYCDVVLDLDTKKILTSTKTAIVVQLGRVSKLVSPITLYTHKCSPTTIRRSLDHTNEKI